MKSRNRKNRVKSKVKSRSRKNRVKSRMKSRRKKNKDSVGSMQDVKDFFYKIYRGSVDAIKSTPKKIKQLYESLPSKKIIGNKIYKSLPLWYRELLIEDPDLPKTYEGIYKWLLTGDQSEVQYNPLYLYGNIKKNKEIINKIKKYDNNVPPPAVRKAAFSRLKEISRRKNQPKMY